MRCLRMSWCVRARVPGRRDRGSDAEVAASGSPEAPRFLRQAVATAPRLDGMYDWKEKGSSFPGNGALERRFPLSLRLKLLCPAEVTACVASLGGDPPADEVVVEKRPEMVMLEDDPGEVYIEDEERPVVTVRGALHFMAAWRAARG